MQSISESRVLQVICCWVCKVTSSLGFSGLHLLSIFLFLLLLLFMTIYRGTLEYITLLHMP